MSRDKTRQELESKRTIWALTVTVAVLVILVIICIVVLTIQRKNRQIESKVTFANELNERLKDLMKSHDSLQESLNRSIEENKASQTLIQWNQETTRRLLASRFDLLDELSRIVTENNNTKTSNRKIADKVTSLINDFTIGGNVIAELEQQIDEVHDNLMADLRQLLPELKEDDYRLYMFGVLGFSSTVISLFLNEDKVKAVYNRKARLKTKIQTLDEQNIKRFMSFLD